MLIGRLTRDPECRMFSNGGKVANFGFAVNNRKKNQQTGQWEDEPVFLDCEAFNRGETGKTADLIEQYLRKGAQAYIEGHLKLDQWNDKTSGEKRTKIKIVVENVQFLEPRRDDGSGGGGGSSQRSGGYSSQRRPQEAPPSDEYDGGGETPINAPPGQGEDIPF
jgi:single-strand DNA-binding protein